MSSVRKRTFKANVITLNVHALYVPAQPSYSQELSIGLKGLIPQDACPPLVTHHRVSPAVT